MGIQGRKSLVSSSQGRTSRQRTSEAAGSRMVESRVISTELDYSRQDVTRFSVQPSCALPVLSRCFCRLQLHIGLNGHATPPDDENLCGGLAHSNLVQVCDENPETELDLPQACFHRIYGSTGSSQPRCNSTAYFTCKLCRAATVVM